MTPTEQATAWLRAWATAIRGDWSEIDGRTCRTELNEIADAITEGREPNGDHVGVCCCRNSGGHWHEPRGNWMQPVPCPDEPVAPYATGETP